MAPITKNSITNVDLQYNKGDDTHRKKVIVVDEQGNEYKATYPKRAKGLVKNGRARFIDDNKICLVCPPKIMEDNVMSDTTKNTRKSKAKLSIDYILDKIEHIVKDSEYIHDALEQLSLMPKSEPGDIAGQEKAKAIGDIVRCRETTNQQALRLYEKMYDDLKPREESPQNKVVEMLSEMAKNTPLFDTEYGAEILYNMLDAIRYIG